MTMREYFDMQVHIGCDFLYHVFISKISSYLHNIIQHTFC